MTVASRKAGSFPPSPQPFLREVQGSARAHPHNTDWKSGGGCLTQEEPNGDVKTGLSAQPSPVASSGVPGLTAFEPAASKAGRADEIPCVAREVFTEEMCLVVFKQGHYSLRQVLVTGCVAVADVIGGNDSGVCWLSE